MSTPRMKDGKKRGAIFLIARLKKTEDKNKSSASFSRVDSCAYVGPKKKKKLGLK